MKIEYRIGDDQYWTEAPDGKFSIVGFGEVHVRITGNPLPAPGADLATDPIEKAWQLGLHADHRGYAELRAAVPASEPVALTEHDLGIIRDIEVMATAPNDNWWSKALALGASRIIKDLRAAAHAPMVPSLMRVPDAALGTVLVCPERDIECGHNIRAWCAACPKRNSPASTPRNSNSPEFDGIKAAPVSAMPDLDRAAPLKHKLTDDEREALRKAAETGALHAELPNGSIMFINRGEDYGDMSECECPYCGGSGHKDDVKVTATLPAAPAPTEQATDFLMPEDAWNGYATLSGLLNEHGVAPDPAKTQTAYFAYIAAWNRLHAAFSAYIVEKRHLISSAAAQSAPDSRDAALLDWLETKVVNVRDPLRYGSRDNFWATPEDRDGDENGPSGLREQCIAAIAQEKAK